MTERWGCLRLCFEIAGYPQRWVSRSAINCLVEVPCLGCSFVVGCTVFVGGIGFAERIEVDFASCFEGWYSSLLA